ncbi:hypothetical protein PFLUV_G00010560 [Perca fluviatilis]|uniref:Uncharacterized protein n=1 Tax=Perca fluviatilis TaxID=8168 RepID=A0A6A5FS09_PERFL|nr:hypothetical protein PFLUV_G00010560 [Perca fluviatilis]
MLTLFIQPLHVLWKKPESPVSERLDLVLGVDGPAGLPAFECQRASRSCHGPSATRGGTSLQSSPLTTRHLDRREDGVEWRLM